MSFWDKVEYKIFVGKEVKKQKVQGIRWVISMSIEIIKNYGRIFVIER